MVMIRDPQDYINQISVYSIFNGVQVLELQQALPLERHKELKEAIIHATYTL